MSSTIEIQLIAIIVSITCSLPGVFLILRKLSMMTDSITHTVLLGIVLAFFITKDLNSPFLIVGATLMGVITVWLTELLTSTKLLSKDSAIGIVFPLLFSIAIILLTKFAYKTHICADLVLFGELAFTPFDRLIIFNIDIGPVALYTVGVVLIINVLFITLFFKELKISTFDPILASVMGISPILMHYGLMTIISLSTVTSFEAVGSVLVIAFMIGPGSTAYLLTDNLKKMLFLSVLFGILSSITGFQLAYLFDVSIAGCMAIMTGVIFTIVLIFAPKRGLITIILRRKKQKKLFFQTILLLHIYNHQNTSDSYKENGIKTIYEHMAWKQKKIDKMISKLKQKKYIITKNNELFLTTYGINTTKIMVDSLLIR